MPRHADRPAPGRTAGEAPALLSLGGGSYGVLFAVAGVSALLGAAAVLPVRFVR